MRNIKAFEVDVSPNGEVIEITGPNGAGKSTVLDAFMLALRGVKHLDRARGYPRGEIITADAESAKLRMILKSGERVVNIVRTLKRTAGGDISASNVKITDAEGKRITQEFLDSLLSIIAIEPLALAHMTPAEQQALIKEATGFDPAEYDKRREDVRKEKGVIDRSIMHKQNSLLEYENKYGADIGSKAEAKASTLDDLYTELNEAHEHNRVVEKKCQSLTSLKQSIKQMEKDLISKEESIGDKHEQILKLKEEINQEQHSASVLEEKINKETEVAENFEIPNLIYIESIQKRIEEAKANQERQHAIKSYLEIRTQLEADKEEVKKYKGQIHTIDKEEAEALQRLPVSNMTFDKAAGIKIQDIPLTEMSTGQQIMSGLQMNGVINPALKAIIVRNADALDDSNIKLVAEYARERGMLLLLESVHARTDQHVIEIAEGVAQ